jgi:predicted  nucleic acid-binding Zn-ribbon protein
VAELDDEEAQSLASYGIVQILTEMPAGETEVEQLQAAVKNARARLQDLMTRRAAAERELEASRDQFEIRATVARIDDFELEITEAQHLLRSLVAALRQVSLDESEGDPVREIVRREGRLADQQEQLAVDEQRLRSRTAALRGEAAYIASLIRTLEAVIGKQAATERLAAVRRERAPSAYGMSPGGMRA